MHNKVRKYGREYFKKLVKHTQMVQKKKLTLEKMHKKNVLHSCSPHPHTVEREATRKIIIIIPESTLLVGINTKKK